MASDLETLKARLWTQFNRACDVADRYAAEAGINAANRNAAGTIVFAIMAIEKEERERAESAKTPTLDKPVLHSNHRATGALGPR